MYVNYFSIKLKIKLNNDLQVAMEYRIMKSVGNVEDSLLVEC